MRRPVSSLLLLLSVTALSTADGGAVRANWQRSRGSLSSVPVQPADRGTRGAHTFFFTRGVYTGHGYRRFSQSWAIDYPEADQHFLIGLTRVTNIDAYERENPVRLDDPDLNLYPVLYMLEVGALAMTDAEVEGLRRYLKAGGFLIIDDFWGSWEWTNFEREMQKLLPGHTIVDLPLDHPVFHMLFDVDEIIQVPNVGNGRRGGPTWEQDGFVPFCKGIFDERGRLMVVINWNTDLGDAWEWADDPYYPLKFSTYAWEMGINFVLYGMSH